MIVSFFVLSPRGDTILSKMYRTRPEIGAHERSHTEAFFRRIKFWNEMTSNSDAKSSNGGGGGGDGLSEGMDGVNASSGAGGGEGTTKMDPPPVFLMPDGQSYFHVNRNGLIFACSTQRNVSPCTVIEVSVPCFDWLGWRSQEKRLSYPYPLYKGIGL